MRQGYPVASLFWVAEFLTVQSSMHCVIQAECCCTVHDRQRSAVVHMRFGVVTLIMARLWLGARLAWWTHAAGRCSRHGRPIPDLFRIWMLEQTCLSPVDIHSLHGK